MQPSYQSGFYAPGRGVAKHPELWRGCVGAWNPGLGNSGLVLRDWSGNQNNGTLTNGPTWGVSGGQQALALDGTNDYVDLGPTSQLTYGSPFSLCWWECVTANTNTYPSRFNLKVNGTASYFLVLRSKSTEGYGNLAWGRAPVSKGVIKSSDVTSPLLSIGVWKHFCITGLDPYSSAPSAYAVYEDGIAKTALVGLDFATLVQNRIGHDGLDGGADAKLADTRIYNRALSPNEIRTLAQRPGIAYERAPRKTYFIQAATSTSQFYDVLSPLIFAGTN